MEDQRHDVAAHHAQQNGDNLDHALAPDVRDDDDHDGDERQRPVRGRVRHSRTGEIQADEDDDRAGDDRGEEAHDLLRADELEQQRQHQIQKTRDHDAAHRVGELFLAGHRRELARVEVGHGLEAAEEGEGRAEEGRHLKLRADVEQQRTDTGKQQRRLDGQRQSVAADEDGDEHRRAEHGKQVLQTQQEHPGRAQLPGVINGVVSEFLVHVIGSSLSFARVSIYILLLTSEALMRKKNGR